MYYNKRTQTNKLNQLTKKPKQIYEQIYIHISLKNIEKYN